MKKIPVKSILLKGITILSVFIFALMVISDQSEFTVTVATLILIAGGACWFMSSSKAYNGAVDNVKRVDGAKDISIEEYFAAVQKIETPLGKAHLGKIKTIKNQCILWGPNANGEYLYAYKNGDGDFLYIAYSEVADFISGEQPQAAQGGKATEYEDLVCYKLDTACMVDDFMRIFEEYTQSRAITSLPVYREGRLYRFNENFNLLGQDFQLCRMNGEPVYDISGTMPLKTFRLKEHESGKEVLKISKQLLHLLPHYAVFLNGERYGTFQKKLDFVHTAFTMALPEGTLLMQSVTATFGDNYRVSVDGRVIGTIAEKLNFTLENLIFDNYVVHVREEKYTAFMAALAVLAAREEARQKNSDA